MMVRRWLLRLPLVLVVLGTVACTDTTPVKPVLTTEEILAKAGQNLKAVNSLHFKLESLGGSTPLGAGLGLDQAEGDVVKPDKMKMQVKANFLRQPIEVGFVSLGAEAYMTNPLNGKWETVSGSINPVAFFDPDSGAVSVLDNMKNPEKLANENLDGTAAYHIRGMVPRSALKSIAGDNVDDGDVKAEVWIGVDDLLPRQLRVEGPIMKGEPAAIVRVLHLSSFDKPVQVEAPK